MLKLKKANLDGKMYDVVKYTEFCSNKELYNNIMTAVEINLNGNNMILPIRSSNDDRPGLYNQGCIDFMICPDDKREEYSADAIVADFSKVKDIKDLIQVQDKIRDIEKEILTNPDNITVPSITGEDSPEMRALKEAIKSKEMDIDKYQERFGPNFPNDKRLLKQNDITQKMLKRICKNLDIKATLILEDVNPDVPNPMNTKISVDLTEINDD